jgi:hypothetical protein
MAADETHHVKMLDDVSVFGDSDSGTAANRRDYSTTVILKGKAVNQGSVIRYQ